MRSFLRRSLHRAKESLKKILLVFEGPLSYWATRWLRVARKRGGAASEKAFMDLGMLPVLDHYYEPLIAPRKHLRYSLREDRHLPGLDMNVKGQLELLSCFDREKELEELPYEDPGTKRFHYDNPSYRSGDAEYLYQMIRYYRPARIIEIGSGHSTLLSREALSMNEKEDPSYSCRHVCIEPYRQHWLKDLPVEHLPTKVEDTELSLFRELVENDILFIDSSHVIRPQGDVLHEHLKVLPSLNRGVLVHIHDIFTPKDYLDEWIYGHRLWNEQYLLEAFLSHNSDFRVVGALNHLYHHRYEELARVCPVLAKDGPREPGAFWMQKVR